MEENFFKTTLLLIVAIVAVVGIVKIISSQPNLSNQSDLVGEGHRSIYDQDYQSKQELLFSCLAVQEELLKEMAILETLGQAQPFDCTTYSNQVFLVDGMANSYDALCFPFTPTIQIGLQVPDCGELDIEVNNANSILLQTMKQLMRTVLDDRFYSAIIANFDGVQGVIDAKHTVNEPAPEGRVGASSDR